MFHLSNPFILSLDSLPRLGLFEAIFLHFQTFKNISKFETLSQKVSKFWVKTEDVDFGNKNKILKKWNSKKI